jgi:hypothetical protein
MPLLFSLVYSPTACRNCSPFLFRVHVGRGSSLLSGGACHTLTAVDAFSSLSTLGEEAPLLPSPASLFIYSLCEGVPLPHSLELREPHPLYYVSFFFSCLFIIQFVFFFFPWWGSVCFEGYADLAQGTACHLFARSPGGLHLPSRLEAGIWQCGSPPGFSV